MKRKEAVPETMLNEKEASQLSDIEFKIMVIRKLNRINENYREATRNSLQTIST